MIQLPHNVLRLAVWLVKPPTTARYEIQTLIGFINYYRLLAFRFRAVAKLNEMTDKELKKKAFLEKASINKMNFDLHLELVKKHLLYGDKAYIEDLKSFYERQVVGDAFLLQLMDYAEEYAERRAVENER